MSSARLPLPGGAALILLVAGGTLVAVGAGMCVAALVALIGDTRAVLELAIPGFATLAAGGVGLAPVARRRRGLVAHRPTLALGAVAMAWVAAALAGAVPLLLAGTFDSPVDALFEAMSGFTTTGATLVADLEAQPQGILFWRSMMQWIGGVGIVVLVVAIAPVAATSLHRVFFAEVSGVTADRLTPRIVDTAKIIVGIYLTLSAAVGVAYLIAGMGPFDALNHMLTTPATGGFSTRDASIGAFDSLAVELVAIAGMALAGVNFAFYWLVIRGGKLMPQASEVGLYASFLLLGTGAVTASLLIAGDADQLGEALRGSAFAATTTLTGTGYVTVDYDQFNDFARIGILILMTIGACAGSTSGGMKVIRIQLLGKIAWLEALRPTQPRAVQVLRQGRRTFSDEARRGILGFFSVYVLIYVAGALAFAISGLDMVTSVSAASATINIVGPGLGEIGATDNWSAVPPGGRVVAIVLMLTGRLELFTIVALLAALVGGVARRADRARH